MRNIKSVFVAKSTGEISGMPIASENVSIRDMPDNLKATFVAAEAELGDKLKLVKSRLSGVPKSPDGSHEIHFLVPRSLEVTTSDYTI